MTICERHNETRRLTPTAKMCAALCALVVLGAAGCGGSSTSTTSSSATAAGPAANKTVAPTGMNGMGEALAAWTASHPAYAGKCEETPCYGEPVTAEGSTTPQFSGVTTTGAPNDLVDGYRQALGTDVPEAVAKRNVLLFLPQDTHTTSFYVVHSSDGSCAFWNLKSATLGHLLAANPKTGDAQGAIGIELATENTELEPTWDPQNVGHAIVSIAPSTPGTAC